MCFAPSKHRMRCLILLFFRNSICSKSFCVVMCEARFWSTKLMRSSAVVPFSVLWMSHKSSFRAFEPLIILNVSVFFLRPSRPINSMSALSKASLMARNDSALMSE